MRSTRPYLLFIATSMSIFTMANATGVPAAISRPTLDAADINDAQFIRPWSPSTSPAPNDFMHDFANIFKGLHWWWKVIILIIFSGLITWSCSCCRSLIINYRPTSEPSLAQPEETPNEQSTTQAQTEERPNEQSTSLAQTEERPNGQSTSQAQTEDRPNGWSTSQAQTEEWIEMSSLV